MKEKAIAARLFNLRKHEQWVVRTGFIFIDPLDGSRKFREVDQYDHTYGKCVKVADRPYELLHGMLWCTDKPDIDKIARIFLAWKLELRERLKYQFEMVSTQIDFLKTQTNLWKESEEDDYDFYFEQWED